MRLEYIFVQNLTLQSPLPPDDFTRRLSAALAEHLAAVSIDPLRPTDSRVIVRTAARSIWVHVLSGRHNLARLSLRGQITSTVDGGSVIRFERRLSISQSWVFRALLVWYLVVALYPLTRMWSHGAVAIAGALGFAAFAGSILVGIYSFGVPQASREIATLETLVATVLAQQQARRTSA